MASKEFVEKSVNVAFAFALFYGCVTGFLYGLTVFTDGINPLALLIPVGFFGLGIGLKLKKSPAFAIPLAILYYGLVISIVVLNKGNDLEGPVNLGRLVFGIPFIFGVVATLKKS